MKNRVMECPESQKIAKGLQKGIYRTFEVEGRTVIIDDFIYRRLFKDPDIKPHRKYTFLSSIKLSNGYPRIVLKTNESFTLSRYIMHAGRGDLVDHINRNRLDNRRCNLRIVNTRQNALNVIVKNNTGYIGVGIYTRKGGLKYCTAKFRRGDGKRLSFVVRDSRINRIYCALVRDKFVIESGDEEYAILNFPILKEEPYKGIILKTELKNLLKILPKINRGKKIKKRGKRRSTTPGAGKLR